MSELARLVASAAGVTLGWGLAFWTVLFVSRRWLERRQLPPPDTTLQDIFERRAVAMGEILREMGYKVLEVEYPGGRFLYRVEQVASGLPEREHEPQAFSLN